jgi:hypothetical protein
MFHQEECAKFLLVVPLLNKNSLLAYLYHSSDEVVKYRLGKCLRIFRLEIPIRWDCKNRADSADEVI